MNGSLYLNAGTPINVSEYYENHKNPSETINNLSIESPTLSSLIINIKDDESYDELYYCFINSLKTTAIIV